MPRTQTQSMRCKLITEGHTTIREGEVPALGWITPSIPDEVCIVINFLRSGCPAVQVSQSSNEAGREREVQELRDALAKFALPGEEFTVTCDGEVALVTRSTK